MIEDLKNGSPNPWRWWFAEDGRTRHGFAASKRAARQAMYAAMVVMPEDSQARSVYRISLGLEP